MNISISDSKYINIDTFFNIMNMMVGDNNTNGRMATQDDIDSFF